MEEPSQLVWPEEQLRQGFQVERIPVFKDPDKGVFYEIVSFPDLKSGKAVWIPRICDFTKEGEMDQMLGSYGFKPSISREMDNEEAERFEKVKELKLPALFEVFLWSRKDINLDEFIKPSDNDPKTELVAILGPSGIGKSLLTAVLSLRNETEALTLDKFTKIGPKQYLEVIEKLGYSKDSSVAEIWEGAKKIRTGANPLLPTKMSLSENLEEMLNIFKNGKRPRYMFIEAVTATAIVDGEIKKMPFTTDAIFLVSRDACEVRVVLEPFDPKLTGFKLVEASDFVSYPIGIGNGKFSGKKVYPPILRVDYRMPDDPNAVGISPADAVDFVSVIENKIVEVVR